MEIRDFIFRSEAFFFSFIYLVLNKGKNIELIIQKFFEEVLMLTAYTP